MVHSMEPREGGERWPHSGPGALQDTFPHRGRKALDNHKPTRGFDYFYTLDAYFNRKVAVAK